MTATSEDISPSLKTKRSPLEFRNTDLVSQLLAATPPYLYNMPLVPNTYFFSEMLRSFVQSKSDNEGQSQLCYRKARKRLWSQMRPEYFQRHDATLNKNNGSVFKDKFYAETENQREEISAPHLKLNKFAEVNVKAEAISYSNRENHMENLGNNQASYINSEPQINQDKNHSNILLPPPPPPLWYPSIYPAPYGIDPLHFFIDLKVSSHIYDNKAGKEKETPHFSMAETKVCEEKILQETQCENKMVSEDIFKKSRHVSAFKVPSSKIISTNQEKEENKQFKFDVKSMGFEKTCNKVSIHYVLPNMLNIYKSIKNSENITDDAKNSEPENDSVNVTDAQDEQNEADKEKKKDLRALIGLELVVDYMSTPKPNTENKNFDDSSMERSDTQSVNETI